jgi:hypothetical protein
VCILECLFILHREWLLVSARDIFHSIIHWMKSSMLKLNEDKTELIVFAPKHRLSDFRNCQLQFDGCVVSYAPFVKNLGGHLYLIASQCKAISSDVIWSYILLRVIGLAAVFWTL